MSCVVLIGISWARFRTWHLIYLATGWIYPLEYQRSATLDLQGMIRLQYLEDDTYMSDHVSCSPSQTVCLSVTLTSRYNIGDGTEMDKNNY